jgi:hypothetical protein
MMAKTVMLDAALKFKIQAFVKGAYNCRKAWKFYLAAQTYRVWSNDALVETRCLILFPTGRLQEGHPSLCGAVRWCRRGRWFLLVPGLCRPGAVVRESDR